MCEKTFANKSNRKRHELRQHKDANEMSQIEKYRCNICDTKFNSKPHLESHISGIHKKECIKNENFECKLCSKLLSSKASLENHVSSIHEKIKR